MSEPQVTVRTTVAGRVTEVVVPEAVTREPLATISAMIQVQIPQAKIFVGIRGGHLAIRQPGGPDVVALAGETLRIAQGRVKRVSE